MPREANSVPGCVMQVLEDVTEIEMTPEGKKLTK